MEPGDSKRTRQRQQPADPWLARDVWTGGLLLATGLLCVGLPSALAIQPRDPLLGAAVLLGATVGLAYSRLVLMLYLRARLAVTEDNGVIYSPAWFLLYLLVGLAPFLLLGGTFVLGRQPWMSPAIGQLATAATGALLGGYFVGSGLVYLRPEERRLG